MNTSITLSPSSVNSNKNMESNYKLALKQFMNKNLVSSFHLTHELYQTCFEEYRKDTISENLFIKIIDLYLIEIGVGLKEDKFNHEDKSIALNSLKELSTRVSNVYGTGRIPSEILYNYHLVFISNRESLIPNKHSYLDELKSNYIKVNSKDKYDIKFMHLVVFEILPLFEEFIAAQNILSMNDMFNEEDWKKLQLIQSNKQEILHQEKLKREELLRKEREEKVKLVKKQTEVNLKYKSIKEIQKSYASEIASEPNIDKTVSKVDVLKDKLVYLTNLLKGYIKDNSLIIIVLLILLIGARKLVNFRKVNLKDKIIETIKMAFKFSYL